MSATNFSLTIPLVVAVLAGGCDNSSTPNAGLSGGTNAVAGMDAASGKPTVSPAVDSSQPPPSRSTNQFVDELHRKLDVCDRQITELGRKLESLSEEAWANGSKAIESWRVQRTQLGQKLDEIKQSGREAGQDIKAGCESAVAELERTFEKLKSRFQE